MPDTLITRLREHGLTNQLCTDAADRIENLEGALKAAHDVFAAEIEGLHKIILMNQPDYKRTIVASADRF